METAVLIRPARPADADTLADLATLEARPRIAGPALVAVRDGRIAAAVGVESGQELGDPFVHTADLLELLRAQARRDRFSGPRPLAQRLGLRHARPLARAA